MFYEMGMPRIICDGRCGWLRFAVMDYGWPIVGGLLGCFLAGGVSGFWLAWIVMRHS
jgi:hypothetical protein